MNGLLWWLLVKLLRHRPRDPYIYGPEQTLEGAPLTKPVTLTIDLSPLVALQENLRQMQERLRVVGRDPERFRAAMETMPLALTPHAYLLWSAGRLEEGSELDPRTCKDMALDLWEIEQLPEAEE